MLNLPTGAGAQTVNGPFISSFDASGNPTFPSLSQVAADPTTATGIATKQYVDARTPYVAATGGDAYAGTFSDIPVLINGQRVAVKFPAANTTTSPTFNLNSIGAISIKMLNGASPAVGVFLINSIYEMLYDSGSNTWVVISVSNPGGGPSGVNNALGSLTIPASVAGVSANFIVNWGIVTPSVIANGALATTTITFATAYVTACYAVLVGVTSGNNANAAENALANSVNSTATTTGFTLQRVNVGGGSLTIGAYWAAIGV